MAPGSGGPCVPSSARSAAVAPPDAAADLAELALWRSAFPPDGTPTPSVLVRVVPATKTVPPPRRRRPRGGGGDRTDGEKRGDGDGETGSYYEEFQMFWPMHWSHTVSWAKEALDRAGGTVTYYDVLETVQDAMRAAADGRVYVDVGASAGFHALAAAAAGHRVVAFEPTPQSFGALARSVLVNGFAGRMAAVNAAVGAEEGAMTIYTPRGRSDNTAMGRDASSANLPGSSVDALDVAMVTLDLELLDRRGLRPEDVSYIKIDVQGFEMAVLRGAARLLEGAASDLRVEVEVDEGLASKAGFSIWDVYEFLSDLGFSPFRVRGGSPSAAARRRGRAPAWEDGLIPLVKREDYSSCHDAIWMRNSKL